MVPTLVVVGHGMVGHRFLEEAVSRGLHQTHRIVVLSEEPRAAYDRVHLSSLFDGSTSDDLALAASDWFTEHRIELVLGEAASELLVEDRIVVTSTGRRIDYEVCVLASGSSAFVPPIPGHAAAGCFVYRTVADLEGIRAWATDAAAGVVVGGGLLGLEAANALRLLGLRTSVVEMAPRLMAVQLDDGGGRALRGHVEALGIGVHTGVAVDGVVTTPDGRVAGLGLAATGDAPARTIPAGLVVFAAGIRPRDQLARDAGLAVGDRGGVIIDDACATAAPGIYAIGEVACHRGRVYGLVAPGQAMAEVAADQIAAGSRQFTGTDLSTRLKLLGVEVASVGNPHAEGHEVVVSDPLAGTWKRSVLDDERRLLGAVLVGDARPFGPLVSALRTGAPMTDALAVLSPASIGTTGPMTDEASVCSCHNVCAGTIRAAVDGGSEAVPAVKACTKAGTGCGSCVPILQELIDEQLTQSGRSVVRHLCPHFAMSRAELFDVVRVTRIRTFAELVARHGSGLGCEVCKPAVASMFASLASGYILDGEQASLQDTNDHFLANLQRDGTYSVVPRVPGGEITPEKLIVIGEVARDFDLYTKITGGQRIDLLGARVDDLPHIWARLVAAGFESGHAYGKAVRTVKSCVGSVWCRYGVQDSVQLAVDLELRYRGLRAPHKIKLAVSGCARECAEAQSKDVGVIATERGWNLYVGGNGGMRPAHAQLLAEDLDTDALVQSIDRYLMWYVRTADRLERTATWQRKLPGGIEHVRRVVMDDALGIAGDLEADMARAVEAYECEWSATLADPARLSRFRSLINDPTGAPLPVRVEIRGQRVPA